MKTTNPPIERFLELVADVLDDLAGNWDFDDGMKENRLCELPYGRLLLALHEENSKAVAWLTFFVARRALPCWELSCSQPRPRELLEELAAHLSEGRDVDWVDLTRPTPSPYDDCRYSDTQSASDAITQCAVYIRTGNPLYAAYCVSSADTACDHVLTEQLFREWFIEVAVPVALEMREMTAAEQDSHRP